ncbi:hypothetical protein ES703_97548 [subsurface metagenome]
MIKARRIIINVKTGERREEYFDFDEVAALKDLQATLTLRRPLRDLAAEIDELKGKVAELEENTQSSRD